MLFRGDDVDKQISLLSGGERARVALCILLLDKPNVLVLAEPTNHLDIASREALEETLKDFAGTILCVSHDRYFLDQVAQRLLVLQPPGIADFEGNYTAWMARLAQKAAIAREEAREAAEAKSRRSSKPQPAKQQPKKVEKKADNPYLRPFGRLSLKELEQQITDTEIELAHCQEAFASSVSFKHPSSGPKLQQEHDRLAKKLKQLEAEYFEREQ